MPNQSSILYLLRDTLGGVQSVNYNLITHRRPDAFAHHVVLYRDRLGKDTRHTRRIPNADTQTTFEYSSRENLYAVLKKLHALLPRGPGVLVSNDWLELAMLGVHATDRTVVQIVHTEFNLGLAKTYEPLVDVFVALSRWYYDQLIAALPHRLDSIVHLPYGIPLAPAVRQPTSGPLRLIFVGRLVESKGIFDLPSIDRLLLKRGVQAQWTVVGDGPQKQALQEQWGNAPHVLYYSVPTSAEVLDLCARNDVFVFPSRGEGFPVSLLEAMSAGLVPVVSDLPSGIPEIVSSETGFRPAVGDCAGFAEAIAELEHDRSCLETMSRACRHTVAAKYDIHERARDYQNLFARYRDLRYARPAGFVLPPGTRLDKPWIPNWFVQAARWSRWRFSAKRAD